MPLYLSDSDYMMFMKIILFLEKLKKCVISGIMFNRNFLFA